MSSQIWAQIVAGIGETFYMVILSTLFAYLFGVPIGIILNITDVNGIKPNRVVNLIFGFVTNVIRSVPFLILLVSILPFTRLIVGTTIGSTATVVPLVVAAAPFVARMVESSLKDVGSLESFAPIRYGKTTLDNGALTKELCKVAEELLKKHPDIGAILLECSDLPPYAKAIQSVTGLPVFDFNTMIDWVYHSVVQKTYFGYF